MRLMHNMASLSTYRTYKKSLVAQSSSMNNISTGLKVSAAKDDPSALSKSESIKMKIRSLQMASRNAQDSVSLIQTTEGGLDEVSNCLQRMRELTIQGDGTKTDDEKEMINKEIEQLKKGINDLVNNTSMNNVNVINGNITKSLKVPSGANSGEYIEIPVTNMNLDVFPSGENSDMNLQDIDINDMEKSLSIIDEAINKLSLHRGKLGGVSNRFESCYNDLQEISVRLEAADSSLVDADVATEMMNLAKNDVLVTAGISIMQQTNNFPQDVLRILQGI
ncbi:flagellin [Clostridium bornimense]|uniref:flagellin N-terminal helical domain-containing protein n=1 Tax=Clostridium bornimense TaxID=1216932 RepID=UPI001C101134|nr:flagellin [Clostridium bornimense]MBU5314777.1 flagellin [Clostridium bornimense]